MHAGQHNNRSPWLFLPTEPESLPRGSQQALSGRPLVVRFHGYVDAVALKLSLDGHFSKVPESGALDSIDTPEYGIIFSLI